MTRNLEQFKIFKLTFEAGSVLIVSNFISFLFMQKKGLTEVCENEFRKIMEFLADYLKMIKLYEKIFCDSGEHFKGINLNKRGFKIFLSLVIFIRLTQALLHHNEV